VLVTGVFGSGKSSVAAEIGYLLEQRNELYAPLDLDYFGWVGDHATGRATMLRNLAAVMPQYRSLSVTCYVLAYFAPDRDTLDPPNRWPHPRASASKTWRSRRTGPCRSSPARSRPGSAGQLDRQGQDHGPRA